MQEQKIIIIVDDEETNRAILANYFLEQYKILEAANGEEAMKLLDEHYAETAIMLLDVYMPVADGFDVLTYMRKKGYISLIPVILITGDDSPETEERAFERGVFDFISKPFAAPIVIRRVKHAIDLYQHTHHLEARVQEKTKQIREQAVQMNKNNDFLIDALSSVVEFRSLESGEHIKRIKLFTRIMLRYLQIYYPEQGITDEMVDEISRAAALHDIGKIAIPDDILLKPGRLTTEEFEIMKTHSALGCDLLEKFIYMKDTKFFEYCYEICRHHHERYDGNGYPDKIKGEEIPMYVQAVSIADVYDALISPRVYKTPYAHDEAVRMIENGECGNFSDIILDCFHFALDDFRGISLVSEGFKMTNEGMQV